MMGLGSGYPLFLLFLPLIVTSSFYFKKYNFVPPLLATVSLLVLSIIFYGSLFFQVFLLSLFNLFIFSILFSIVSVVIGLANISYRDLKRSEEFLDTLIRQDLRSKSQLAMGYFSFIEDNELSGSSSENFNKGKQSLDEVINLIEQIKSFKQIDEGVNRLVELDSEIKKAIKVANNQLKEYGGKIEINFNKKDKNVEVLADNNLRLLIQNLIKMRSFKAKVKKIEITQKIDNEKPKIILEDDKNPLSKEEQKNLFDKTYTGETTGIGGVRAYIIQKLLKKYNGKIRIEDSELGGSKFIIQLKTN